MKECYDSIENTIIHSSNQARISKKILSNQAIVTEEIKKLIEQRHTLRNKENKSRQENYQLGKQYRIISKDIKRNTKKYSLNIIENYLEKTGAVKKAYKHLSNSKRLLSQLQNRSGAVVTKREDLMQVATDYYTKIYKNVDDPIPKFNENKIEHSINTLKSEKSPGPDSITNEMIIAGKDTLVNPLMNLFNLILTSKELRQW